MSGGIYISDISERKEFLCKGYLDTEIKFVIIN